MCCRIWALGKPCMPDSEIGRKASSSCSVIPAPSADKVWHHSRWQRKNIYRAQLYSQSRQWRVNLELRGNNQKLASKVVILKNMICAWLDILEFFLGVGEVKTIFMIILKFYLPIYGVDICTYGAKAVVVKLSATNKAENKAVTPNCTSCRCILHLHI